MRNCALNADGSLDPVFLAIGTGVNGFGSVTSIAPQDDGKVLIGGAFNFYNGTFRGNIARLCN